MSVYVDAVHRGYLDDVIFAGHSRRSRGVNASAVLRFALDRQQVAMTSGEVCEAIAAKPVDDSAMGRKRR